MKLINFFTSYIKLFTTVLFSVYIVQTRTLHTTYFSFFILVGGPVDFSTSYIESFQPRT